MQISDEEKLFEIFLSYYCERKKKFELENKLFVHYTSAEAAIEIIRSAEFWLRETGRMNDWSETEYGFSCLNEAYKKHIARLQKSLNRISVNLAKEIENLFNGWWQHIRYRIYISCFSEYSSNEDELGKLSMWRAYGGKAGVALVLNKEPFFDEEGETDVFTSPVFYSDLGGFVPHFENLIEKIEGNVDFLSKQDAGRIKDYIFNAFLHSVVSTKHLGFKEEQEWRVICIPDLFKPNSVIEDVKTISGIPQIIYKFPLKDIPEKKIKGVEIPSLINKIIIGPADNPLTIGKAFEIALEKAGVNNPKSLISYSNIPLRT